MPQGWISLANFDKYQKDSKRTYPWIPLYKKLLVNPQFLKLDIQSRYLYVCLCLISSDCGNKIPNDVSYLAHRCSMPVSQVDLRPLYRCGLLQASRTTVYRRVREMQRNAGEMSMCESEAPPTPTLHAHPVKRQISDEDQPTEKHLRFAQRLGIDPGPEWGKFKNYCLAHAKRYANFEAAFRNWLANAHDMKARPHAVR